MDTNRVALILLLLSPGMLSGSSLRQLTEQLRWIAELRDGDEMDAKFVEAFSPATVLALLDRLARCEMALRLIQERCSCNPMPIQSDINKGTHRAGCCRTISSDALTPPEGT